MVKGMTELFNREKQGLFYTENGIIVLEVHFMKIWLGRNYLR